jgi:proline iminopeptidase/L-proline amide hydrolase
LCAAYGRAARPVARFPAFASHGGPGASHAYLLATFQLSRDRAVILYNQLDSGLSDHPGDPGNWTVERFASEIEALRWTVPIHPTVSELIPTLLLDLMPA